MITQEEIKNDLEILGLERGDTVLVHASLSSIGNVENGAYGLLDALLEVIGVEGTLIFPTFTYTGIFSGDSPYDLERSPSEVGIVSEVFRKRKGVLRSFHPTHSVASSGAEAEFMIKGHLESPSACGKETPFGRLIDHDGKVLLIGVDQDRNTTLHALEERVNAPYLSTVDTYYMDVSDMKQKKVLKMYPGPHRNFIGLDRLFRAAGVMRVGKVGKAVSRLLKAGEMAEIVLEGFGHDPALVLCDNPACSDCQVQRGKIDHRMRLDKEAFTLSAVVNDLQGDQGEALNIIKEAGINSVEISTGFPANGLPEMLEDRNLMVSAVSVTRPDDVDEAVMLAEALRPVYLIIPPTYEAASLAERVKKMSISLLLKNQLYTPMDTFFKTEEVLTTLDSIGLAFDPVEYVKVGEKPFLHTYYQSGLKKYIRQVYLHDALWSGEPRHMGSGNAELKELISALRCRNFDGYFTLRADNLDFKEVMSSFWRLMNTM